MALSSPEAIAKLRAAATGRRHTEYSKDKLRLRTGSKNHNWGGGLTINAHGYLAFTASKANGEQAGKFLHQIVAEWKYKRVQQKGEHVHHVDGNKLNNEPDNLVFMTATVHAKYHTQDRENGKRSKSM